MGRLVIGSALVAATAGSSLASEVVFRQSFGPVTVGRYVDGAEVDSFFGLGFETGDVVMGLTANADGVENPVYQGTGHQGANPLYNGRGGQSDLLGRIVGMTYVLGPVTNDTGSRGVLPHRDVSVMDLVMTTDFGTYRSVEGAGFVFGVDAPASYFADGAVTWTTIEPMRLYLNGDGSSGDYFEFNGTWFTDTAVPAPGAVVLFGVAGVVGARRRR